MDEHTPILVGGGQVTRRGDDPAAAEPPMALAAAAAAEALTDAAADARLAARIDAIAVMRLLSDSSSRLVHTYGRAGNPPRAVARRLGIEPRLAIYGEVGGNTPQKYLHRFAGRIARGELRAVLLCGAEAIRSERQAARAGIALAWDEHDDGPLEDHGTGIALATPHEITHGVGVPGNTYPLFEQSLRAARGRDVASQMRVIGELFAPFATVAAANPYAAFPIAHPASVLVTPGPDNPFIGFPYPRLVNPRDTVDQAAAVVMTSVGEARAAGIPPERWIFIHGCADINERIMMLERVGYGRSPAIAEAGRAALEMAGLRIDDIALFDLYSCFASTVQLARDALGIDAADTRRLTVTGGLPFFGGPGNNYAMHALAEMIARLRASPDAYGLVNAHGGVLSKHAVGIYSARPIQRRWQPVDTTAAQARINAAPSPAVTEVADGRARVETCTVIHVHGEPSRGLVIGRLDRGGYRFVANTPPDDRAALARLMADDAPGAAGQVRREGKYNLFEPQ